MKGVSDEPRTLLEAALDKAVELIVSELEGTEFADPGLVLLARVPHGDRTTSGACVISDIEDMGDVQELLVHLLIEVGGPVLRVEL